MNRHYLYVDGESHFINADKLLTGAFGENYASQSLVRFTGPRVHSPLHLRSDCRYFWDYTFFERTFPNIEPERRYYCTCFTGTTEGLFDTNVFLRKHNFEPHVVQELKDLAKARDNMLNAKAVLIKAKGVDTGLVVRLLEDAYNDLFDVCILFASDADFIPAIEAVKRQGKRVIVVGYSDCLQKNSPLFFVPEKFIDIGGVKYFKDNYGPKPP